jgi:threonine/homoserine/homoserine lactone efflux protein
VTTAFPHVLAFTAAAAVLVATPGLDTAVILRQALGGPKSAALAAGGVVMGLLVWGLAAAAGLTAVLLASRLAYTALK